MIAFITVMLVVCFMNVSFETILQREHEKCDACINKK